MASEDDFVFFGTPIAREEEITTRKQKALAEASGQLRTLPAWKQEVTDEEGRRRFHGAFTGGYSAGYYNTVGSKEGWTPQSFTSSRKNRAEFQKQDIFNFLDEDEKAELDARSLGTNMSFDTFGFTAKELALKEAEKEQQKRPSAIPGPIPDEMVAPVTESIGVKLLLKMGWHRGRSIKKSNTNTLSDIHKESIKDFLAFSSDDTKDVESSELVESDAELVRSLSTSGDTGRFSGNTPVYVLNPKQNLHGLGYDPFKHAPEFRDKRRSQASGASEKLGRPSSLGNRLFGLKSGRVAPGFGIGALEDLDAEDEDVYDAGYHFEDSYVEEIEEPTRAMIDTPRILGKMEDGILPGFKAASNSDNQLERYDPPVIPKDFVPHHKFILPYDPGNKFAYVVPPEALPPVDNNLKILIDGMASLVARCGKLFEDLSKQKHQANPLFGFLFGGEGHDYYAWKLWEEQQKHRHLPKQFLHAQTSQDAEKKMTAETRGKILGEKPLERSITNSAASVRPTETFNLQFQLADTFTKPASLSDVPEVSKPFQDDPAKQERFEQFLKEKYHGGLRSKDAGGSSKMSEAARARERLEFEAAAEAIEKGKTIGKSKISGDLLTDVFTTSELQFTSGVQERAKVGDLVKGTTHPRREEFQWRPAPILCKRFDLIDPFMGKPPPPPRPRSKMDTLIFVPDPAISSKVEKGVSPDINLSNSLMNAGDKGSDAEAEAVEEEVGNVERPVDLYKAIFSDDSDDGEENNNPNLDENPQKKTEVVNRTVNRLIAGDFLESLGKELGLEVPPDLPYSEIRGIGADVTSEIRTTANQGETEENKRLYEDNDVNKSLTPNMAQQSIQQSHEHIVQEERSLPKNDITKEVGREEAEEKAKSGRQRRREDISESSEEDSRSRRHRRRRRRSRRHRSISSGSDTSDHHSRSTRRKRNKSSDDNKSSGGRRHSKHRKHRHNRQDSPERDSSRYGSGREHREAKEKQRR